MREKIPQLDAVRGIAVLMVIMVHASDKYPTLHLQPCFQNGWMGVDLFFVLSGFLITRILLQTKESENYFKNFYARRCLRIWPLYYSVLLLMFVVIPFMRPSEAATIFESRSSPWWAYPLFLQNFLVPVPTNATGPLGVTWSLAIEEQFYLFWPWVVRYCSQSQLRKIAIAVICVSPVLRLFLSLQQVNIYSNLFCRLDGLMAGGFLALTVSAPGFRAAPYRKWAWISLSIAAPLAWLMNAVTGRWIVLSFTAVAAASFVYLALFSEQKWLRTVLTSRFLVYTGTISYGLYLLHKIPFDIAQSFHLSRLAILVMPLGMAAGYALAFLSWNLLERPFLRAKRFFVSTAAHAVPIGLESSPGVCAVGTHRSTGNLPLSLSVRATEIRVLREPD